MKDQTSFSFPQTFTIQSGYVQYIVEEHLILLSTGTSSKKEFHCILSRRKICWKWSNNIIRLLLVVRWRQSNKDSKQTCWASQSVGGDWFSVINQEKFLMPEIHIEITAASSHPRVTQRFILCSLVQLDDSWVTTATHIYALVTVSVFVSHFKVREDLPPPPLLFAFNPISCIPMHPLPFMHWEMK